MRRRYFFVREMREAGEIAVCWVEGKENEADALTKALPTARFQELTSRFRGKANKMVQALVAGLRRAKGALARSAGTEAPK